jgi:hypothetical protein
MLESLDLVRINYIALKFLKKQPLAEYKYKAKRVRG